MQNVIQKFRQSSTVFEKPGILPEKLKTLTSSNYHRVDIFVEFLHRFPFLLTNVYKRVFGIFFILFRSWVICQNQKMPGFTHPQKPGLSITQDLNKTENFPNTLS